MEISEGLVSPGSSLPVVHFLLTDCIVTDAALMYPSCWKGNIIKSLVNCICHVLSTGTHCTLERANQDGPIKMQQLSIIISLNFFFLNQ